MNIHATRVQSEACSLTKKREIKKVREGEREKERERERERESERERETERYSNNTLRWPPLRLSHF